MGGSGWDESKHPRKPSGTEAGGEFAGKLGSSAHAAGISTGDKTSDAAIAQRWSVPIVRRSGGGPGTPVEVEAASEAEAYAKVKRMHGRGSSFKIDIGRGAKKL